MLIRYQYQIAKFNIDQFNFNIFFKIILIFKKLNLSFKCKKKKLNHIY